MIENLFYGPEFHGEYDVASVGRLELEEGGTIPDCRLAYTTWGELSPARDIEGEYKSNADVVAGLTRRADLWAVMGFHRGVGAGVLAGDGFRLEGGLPRRAPAALLHSHGPQRPAVNGVEV
jgi:hypothetical protein